ncbi:MAG: guanylate kinase [Candidatus Omnitrophica bacterium]|nr:guanylate kinase [Candidatus Omnitrophota bacterium]
MNQGSNIYIISGPSGSGKTTLSNRLLKLKTLKHKLVKSLSVTTRPRRAKEKNRKDYIFVTQDEFLKRRKKGEFLESQAVFEYLYGTSKRFVKKALKEKKNVLLCIDVKGALSVKKLYPNAVAIFILPPSLKILQKRLTNRLTEDKKKLHRRLKLAKKEMSYIKHYDYIVINDDLKKAIKQLESIFIAEYCRRCYGLSTNRRIIAPVK